MIYIYLAYIFSSKTSFGFYLGSNLHDPFAFILTPSLTRSVKSLFSCFLLSLSLSICQGQQSAKNHIKKYSNVELVAIGIHTSIKDCQI